MKNLLKNLEDKVSDRKHAIKELKNWESKLEGNLNELEDLEEARTLIIQASKITQTQLSNKISKIVTSALGTVFEYPYTFVIDFVSRRNNTECDLLFEKNGKRKSPLASCGYGAADIASLALRVAYWTMDDEARNVLVLDEPTRNLDTEKQELASMLIKNLSRMEGGLQFIIVTHKKPLAESADKQFRVTKADEISSVKLIKELTNGS